MKRNPYKEVIEPWIKSCAGLEYSPNPILEEIKRGYKMTKEDFVIELARKLIGIKEATGNVADGQINKLREMIIAEDKRGS